MLDETESALSINANSIDSSILTEFSGSHLISSVNSCENDESSRKEQIVMDYDETMSDATLSQPLAEKGQESCWYNQLEIEENWEEFQDRAKQLLDAVDCPLEERDELIAQLIFMEEQMFWSSGGKKCCDATTQPYTLSWLLEVAAASAAIAFAGIVMVRFLKTR
jgi:hypothetical protein